MANFLSTRKARLEFAGQPARARRRALAVWLVVFGGWVALSALVEVLR